MQSVATVLAGALCVPALFAQNTIRTFDGLKLNDAQGCAVASAGDVDKDGVADVIVGATRPQYPGSATVYSGRDGHVLHHLKGAAIDTTFGIAVGAMGDVDKDGYGDFFVGAAEDCG